MTQRRQYILFFGLVAAVVIAAFVLGKPRAPASLVDAVPKDAWLVARVDVAALRDSPLVKPILGDGDFSNIPGLGSIKARCGFDPVSRLGEVVVTSPEHGERGEFAVVFTGQFTKEEMQSCAESVILARGGKPTMSAHAGGFTYLEDTADETHSRLVYREGGPFLVGRGAWLEASVDAVLGKGERANPAHADLRRTLAPKTGKPPQVIVVTALLPDSVRGKLKTELAGEASGDASQTFGGVLGVSSLGLAIATGGLGSTTDVTVEMHCESASACDEVDKLIEKKKLGLSRDIAVRLAGIGPLLDSLALSPKGPTLSVTASIGTNELASSLQRVLSYRGRPPSAPVMGGPPPAPAAPAPSNGPK